MRNSRGLRPRLISHEAAGQSGALPAAKAPLRNSHAVSDRVGALSIEMLAPNESGLREVACPWQATSTARTGAEPPSAENRRMLCERSFRPSIRRKSGRRREAPTSDAPGRESNEVLVGGRIVHAAGKNGFGLISPPLAANSARLFGGRRRKAPFRPITCSKSGNICGANIASEGCKMSDAELVRALAVRSG